MPASSRTPTLRVLSYNIHKGFSFGNRRFLLDEMRSSIRLVNADLVFLQEVVGENQRNHQRVHNWTPRQFEYLADESWPHYAYGKNAIYSHGHHGNAILSRHPFARVDNLNVSHLPVSQRGILYGTIHHARTNSNLHVICVHFGLSSFERRRQTLQLCDMISTRFPDPGPLIIAGDFNDWNLYADRPLRQQSGLREALQETLGHRAKTFPAFAPMLPMDRIYYRNLTLRDARVLSGQPWSTLSDHCALYAEFTLS